jgi:hypothetical protein
VIAAPRARIFIVSPALEKDALMSSPRLTAQQVIGDQDVDLAISLTGQMFGLPKDKVITIVQVGLPMMARMAESNSELFKRLYALSQATLPEPVQAFYQRLVQNPVIRQSAMDDYKTTFGSMLDAVNREAARQAGTTDGQAREVLAAMLPAVSQALAEPNPTGSETGFANQLRRLSA